MMAIVDDFASIGAKLSEIEKKIPKPESDTAAPALAETIVKTWMDMPVVWTPEHGYTTPPQDQGMCFQFQAGEVISAQSGVSVDFARSQLYAMYGLGYQGDKEPN